MKDLDVFMEIVIIFTIIYILVSMVTLHLLNYLEPFSIELSKQVYYFGMILTFVLSLTIRAICLSFQRHLVVIQYYSHQEDIHFGMVFTLYLQFSPAVNTYHYFFLFFISQFIFSPFYFPPPFILISTISSFGNFSIPSFIHHSPFNSHFFLFIF